MALPFPLVLAALVAPGGVLRGSGWERAGVRGEREREQAGSGSWERGNPAGAPEAPGSEAVGSPA
jgi:hypothetical protein